MKREGFGRPTAYDPKYIPMTKEYIDLCEDEVTEFHKTRGEKSDGYDRIINVKIPTIEGLAGHINIARSTIYLWKEEHKDFSDIIDELLEKQSNMLISNGLSGNYNPTIAKVLLTKHGYREGLDATSDGKQIQAVPVTGVRVIIERE